MAVEFRPVRNRATHAGEPDVAYLEEWAASHEYEVDLDVKAGATSSWVVTLIHRREKRKFANSAYQHRLESPASARHAYAIALDGAVLKAQAWEARHDQP